MFECLKVIMETASEELSIIKGGNTFWACVASIELLFKFLFRILGCIAITGSERIDGAILMFLFFSMMLFFVFSCCGGKWIRGIVSDEVSNTIEKCTFHLNYPNGVGYDNKDENSRMYEEENEQRDEQLKKDE